MGTFGGDVVMHNAKEIPHVIELDLDMKQEDEPVIGNDEGKRPKQYKTRSIAWLHVVRLECQKKAKCKYCPKTFRIENSQHGTGNMLKHFRYYCPKAPESLKRADPKQKILSPITGMPSLSYSAESCRMASAELIIVNELPFRFVEGDGFKKICKTMQHKFQVPSRAIITRDCMKLYGHEKEKVRAALIGQRLSLTTDTWTSVQNLNYMCLTAHLMARNMKAKFNKYLGNVQITNMLLYIAVVLDPRRKMKYVEFWFDKLMDKNDASDLKKKVRGALTRLFEWYVKNDSRNSTVTCNFQQGLETMSQTEEDMTDRNAFDHEFELTLMDESGLNSDSELEQYLLDTCISSDNNFNILNWWRLNSDKYPRISQIARAVLAVPVSTVASESCFSTGGRILDPFRSSLSPLTVEALICSQNWIKPCPTGINLRDEMDYVTAYEKAFIEEESNNDTMKVD